MKMKEYTRIDRDTPWKEGIEHMFQPCMKFFFPNMANDIDWQYQPKSLDKELPKIVQGGHGGKQIADKLMEVKTNQGTQLYIHLEIQAQKDNQFEERMFWYNTRMWWRFGQPVVSIGLLIDEVDSWVPNRFSQRMYGWQTNMTFMTAKMMHYRDQQSILWLSENPFARVVLSHLISIETKEDHDKRRELKIELVKGMETKPWSPKTKRDVFNFVDWVLVLEGEDRVKFDTALKKEKSMYFNRYEREAMGEAHAEGMQQGMQQGMLKGRKEGLEEGKQQGEHDGLAKALRRLLEVRFNQSLSDELKAKLQAASLTQLETWTDRILVVESIEQIFEEN